MVQLDPAVKRKRIVRGSVAVGLLVFGGIIGSASRGSAQTPVETPAAVTVTVTATAPPVTITAPAEQVLVTTTQTVVQTTTEQAVTTVTAQAAAPAAAAPGPAEPVQAAVVIPEPAVDVPEPAVSVYFGNCSEAKAAGAAPLYRGDPGYRSAMDRDDDGVACE